MLIDGIPELTDYRLTVEEAEAVVVPWSKKKRTLGWYAKRNPAKLDRLLARESLVGTMFFHAVVLVNEKYEKQIAFAVNNRNNVAKDKRKARKYNPLLRKMILPSILHSDYFK